MYGTTPARGFYAEIIRQAFSRVGIAVTVTGYPWKRALELGRNGAVAIGGIYQNPTRMTQFDYSLPFHLETLRVCIKAGHGFVFRGVVDLAGKRVGINRGWSYGEVFDSARREGVFTSEEASDNMANLKKLELERVDCIIIDEISLRQIVSREKWQKDLEILDFPAAVNSVHLVFAKQARQTPVIDRFNQGLLELKANGTYARLVDQYLGLPDMPAQ
jgi:polar amino acid transport system substrate-binding protein